ncbi:hypothetical protein JYU03_00485 [bacterium AH-315-F03]|nr:hypothetical protein [bacterium AH-315-F03]
MHNNITKPLSNAEWITDTLMGYVEDREVNLKKSISSNIGQFRLARKLYHRNILDIGAAQYAKLIGRWSLKLLALNALRVKPSLYLKSVQKRSQGEKPVNWKLGSEKREFLQELRRRNQNNDWSCESITSTYSTETS